MLWYDKYSGRPYAIGIGRELQPDRVLLERCRQRLASLANGGARHSRPRCTEYAIPGGIIPRI